MATFTIEITEGQHYRLDYYEDHGWEWSGFGIFDDHCCEYPLDTEEAARNEAVQRIKDLLTE